MLNQQFLKLTENWNFSSHDFTQLYMHRYEWNVSFERRITLQLRKDKKEWRLFALQIRFRVANKKATFTDLDSVLYTTWKFHGHCQHAPIVVNIRFLYFLHFLSIPNVVSSITKYYTRNINWYSSTSICEINDLRIENN